MYIIIAGALVWTIAFGFLTYIEARDRRGWRRLRDLNQGGPKVPLGPVCTFCDQRIDPRERREKYDMCNACYMVNGTLKIN